MKKIIVLLLLTINIHLLFANENLKRCVKNDLIGTWTVTHSVFLNKSLRNDFNHLEMPVQLLMYKNNNQLHSLYSSSTKHTLEQNISLLEFPQDDTYKVVEGGVVVISRHNQIIDMYTCDLIKKEIKKKGIFSGSIMLTRVIDKKPAIVNIFKKVTNP